MGKAELNIVHRIRDHSYTLDLNWQNTTISLKKWWFLEVAKESQIKIQKHSIWSSRYFEPHFLGALITETNLPRTLLKPPTHNPLGTL